MLKSLDISEPKGYNNITPVTLQTSLLELAEKHNAFAGSSSSSSTPDVGLQIAYTQGTETRKLFEYAYQYSVLGGTTNVPTTPGDHGSGWCSFNSTTTADPQNSPKKAEDRQFCVNYNNNASYQETIIGCTEGHHPDHLMCSTDYLNKIGAYEAITTGGDVIQLPLCGVKYSSPQKLTIQCRDTKDNLCKKYFEGRTIETVQTAAGDSTKSPPVPPTYQYPTTLNPDMSLEEAMGLKWQQDACDIGFVAVVANTGQVPPTGQLDKCLCNTNDKELSKLGPASSPDDCKDKWQNAVCCTADKGTQFGHDASTCDALRRLFADYEDGCQMCTSQNEKWRLPAECPNLKYNTLHGQWDNYGEDQVCKKLKQP